MPAAAACSLVAGNRCCMLAPPMTMAVMNNAQTDRVCSSWSAVDNMGRGTGWDTPPVLPAFLAISRTVLEGKKGLVGCIGGQGCVKRGGMHLHRGEARQEDLR